MHIPFNIDVKLRGITIGADSDGTAPIKMRAFVNRADIDFETAADLQPAQEWDLGVDVEGTHRTVTARSGSGSLAGGTSSPLPAPPFPSAFPETCSW